MIKARYAGQPKGDGRSGGTVSGELRRERAEAFAKSLLPAISEARQAGCRSNREIADYFNERGIRAALGANWSRVQVRQLIARVEAMSEL
jgi:hypothetical protein